MFSHYCVKTFGIENVYKQFLFAGSSLVIFFMLQGFLATPSVYNNNIKMFIKKRMLRLYPSFIMTLIATVIVVLCNGNDVSVRNVIAYFAKEMLFWSGSDFYGISNGAVWAIFIQLQVYFVLYLTIREMMRINNHYLPLIILVFLIMVNYFDETIRMYIDENISHHLAIAYSYFFLRFAYFFYLGFYIYKYKDIIVPFLSLYAYWLILLHVIWHLDLFQIPSGYCYTDPITVITASLAAVGIAYRLKKIKFRCEISYDVFVWHMPVYTGLSLFYDQKGWGLVVLSIVITIILSFFSNSISKKIVDYSISR